MPKATNDRITEQTELLLMERNAKEKTNDAMRRGE